MLPKLNFLIVKFVEGVPALETRRQVCGFLTVVGGGSRFCLPCPQMAQLSGGSPRSMCPQHERGQMLSLLDEGWQGSLGSPKCCQAGKGRASSLLGTGAPCRRALCSSLQLQSRILVIRKALAGAPLAWLVAVPDLTPALMS